MNPVNCEFCGSLVIDNNVQFGDLLHKCTNEECFRSKDWNRLTSKEMDQFIMQEIKCSRCNHGKIRKYLGDGLSYYLECSNQVCRDIRECPSPPPKCLSCFEGTESDGIWLSLEDHEPREYDWILGGILDDEDDMTWAVCRYRGGKFELWYGWKYKEGPYAGDTSAPFDVNKITHFLIVPMGPNRAV